MRITDVVVATDLNMDAQGFYVDVTYQKGDHGTNVVTYGPFPKDRKDAFIEFLNVIVDTFNLYLDKRYARYWTHHKAVENYSLWFDREPGCDGTSADALRAEMNLKSETYKEQFELACQVIEYKAYYQDGFTPAKFPLNIVY